MTPVLRITERRRARRDEWESVCRQCEYATWFHTPAWVDLCAREYRRGSMVAAPELIRFSDGASALLPLACRHYLGGAVRLYWSMPAHTFGGWLSVDKLTVGHAMLLSGILRKLPDLVWRENPYDPVLASLSFDGAREDFTQAIDLTGGSSVVAGRFDYAHRKAARKAAASGVTVAEAVHFEEWESYFSLYDASRARWKERRIAKGDGYSHAFLGSLFEAAPEVRKLWLARVNGVVAAGILCFYWNRHAVAWHGAGGAEFFMYRPNNLLYEHAIRHAAEEGYRWFDCNPSASLRGVMEFKEHLGAIPLRSRIIEKKSFIRHAAERLRDLVR
jgi:hypothetical protein